MPQITYRIRPEFPTKAAFTAAVKLGTRVEVILGRDGSAGSVAEGTAVRVECRGWAASVNVPNSHVMKVLA